MLLIDTCPICGENLVDMCFPTYPPQYGKQCFHCGWVSEIVKEEIYKQKYKKENKYKKIASKLSEHFWIPCDLCAQYFIKDGSCPKEIENCSNCNHWELLLERIDANESQR